MVNKSLISIIDEWFDKYNDGSGEERITPYSVETNATIESFFKKTYTILKNGSLFENEALLETYKGCVEELIENLKFLVNSKVFKYEMTLDSSNGNLDKAYGLVDGAKILANKYTDRDFYKYLDEDEQKIGYEDYYDETIYIANDLIPTFDNTQDSCISYSVENNPNMIILNKDGTCSVVCDGEQTDFSSFQELTNEIIRLAGNGSLLEFYQTQEQISGASNNTTYYFSFSFSNGFLVNSNNEYENGNGIFLELLNCLALSFEKKENLLEEKLKQYFYSVLLEKYRTKAIVDNSVDIKVNDLEATNGFKVLTPPYETLGGKAGNLGMPNTIDYGYSGFRNKSAIKLPFEMSVFHDSQIDYYINKNFLTGTLAQLKNYDKFDFDSSDSNSYLTNRYLKHYYANQVLTSKYYKYYKEFSDDELGYVEEGINSNKEAALYIKYHGDELKKNLLRQEFFAVRAKFQPNLDDVFTSSYFENVPTLEEETFYDDTVSPNLDLSLDDDYLILTVYTSISTTVKENYGCGVLEIKKTEPKFCDNTVSCLVQTDTTSKDGNFSSKEFSSILDDREITVVSKTDTMLAETENGYSNVEYDESGLFFVESSIPSYKSTTIKKLDDCWKLDCSDFNEYNNIDAIKQVRVIFMQNNTYRYLFNVRGVVEEHTPQKRKIIELSFDNISNYGVTYGNDEEIIFDDETATSLNTSISDEIFGFGNSSKETVTFDTSDDVDYAISITPNDLEIDGSYIEGDTIVLSSDDSTLEPEDDTTIIGGEVKDVYCYTIKKYLILEPNIVVDKLGYSTGDEIDCEILDFISVNGNPKRKELGQFVYTSESDNSYTIYEPEAIEAEGLRVGSKSSNIKIYTTLSKLSLYSNKLVSAEMETLKLKVKSNIDYRFYYNFIVSPEIKKISIKNIIPSVSFGLPIRVSGNISNKEFTFKDYGMLFNGDKKRVFSAKTSYLMRKDQEVEDMPVSMNVSFADTETSLNLLSDAFFCIRTSIPKLYSSILYSNNVLYYKEPEISFESSLGNSYIHKLESDNELSLEESTKGIAYPSSLVSDDSSDDEELKIYHSFQWSVETPNFEKSESTKYEKSFGGFENSLEVTVSFDSFSLTKNENE